MAQLLSTLCIFLCIVIVKFSLNLTVTAEGIAMVLPVILIVLLIFRRGSRAKR